MDNIKNNFNIIIMISCMILVLLNVWYLTKGEWIIIAYETIKEK